MRRRQAAARDFIQDGAAVSRAYRRLPPELPPPELDLRIRESARAGRPAGAAATGVAAHGSPYLAPLALAATVLLSVAVVVAIILGPRARRAEDPPRVMPATAQVLHHETAPPLVQSPQLYTSDPPAPRESAAGWLARIAALRKAGRDAEADAQYRRFLAAYPAYAAHDPGW